MSKLFRKVSWPHQVEHYDRLREEAKKIGHSLSVKNGGTRTVPMFIFYLKAASGELVKFSYDLDGIAAYLRRGA